MKLSYLIKSCTPVWARIIDPVPLNGAAVPRQEVSDMMYNPSDPEITSIHANAGEVKPGGLFVAIKGFKADGHDYIGQAIANGAAAVVTQKKIEKRELSDLSSHYGLLSKPVMVEVPDSRKAMSSIASCFYGNPSDSMVVIGVTGTNGKTTTAFLIESILKAWGCETGVVGTVNFRYSNKTFDNPVTTPESIDLQRILSQMREAGVTHVVMEVSSHAIDLHRVRDCAFDVGVFTNLTQDHLDYHKTMAAYFACKKKFFTKQLKRGKKGERSISVINVDHPYGKLIFDDSASGNCIAVGFGSINGTTSTRDSIGLTDTPYPGNKPHIYCSGIEDDISGLRGNLQIRSDREEPTRSDASALPTITIPFNSRLAGQFNLENILCATGAVHALGAPPEVIKIGIESCHGVPGRLERVANSGERYLFVDYAHTPNALESILETLKSRAPGRLIAVFGCGGNRDKTKRPIMGEIACRYSDISIVTSDNPRSEDPETIISEILAGMVGAEAESGRDLEKRLSDGAIKAERSSDGSFKKQIIVEPDRARALEIAVAISLPGDIVVAAGKGHETYQVTAHGKIDFDDRVILGEALINCGFVTEAL